MKIVSLAIELDKNLCQVGALKMEVLRSVCRRLIGCGLPSPLSGRKVSMTQQQEMFYHGSDATCSEGVVHIQGGCRLHQETIHST